MREVLKSVPGKAPPKKRNGRPPGPKARAEDAADVQELGLLERFEAVPSFGKIKVKSYTKEQIAQACIAYILTGSPKNVFEISGVPQDALTRYRREQWWEDISVVAREIISDRMEDKLTGLVNRVMQELADRIDRGNETVMRDGSKVVTPLSGAELGRLLGIMFDKRQLLRGDVTSRSETTKVSQAERLADLKRVAEDLVDRIEEKN